MRIVFLNPLGEMGGAERSLLAWMNAVRQAYPSAKLHLLVPSDGLFARRARDMGIEVDVVPSPDAVAKLGENALRGGRLMTAFRLGARATAALPGALAYAFRLRAALRRLKPDLIHSNGIKPHLLARLTAPSQTPVVWHIHDFIGHRPLMARVVAWASSSCKMAVAVSEAVAVDARSVMPKLPVRVVYNVTNVDHFSPGPGDGSLLDAIAGLPQTETGTVRVVLVATYAHWKGQDIFLDAAMKALQGPDVPPMRFYVVGGPIYQTAGSQFSQAQLRASADASGLGSRVGFIGFQDDPAVIYRAADIVVHASTRPEPFGLTVIEAMACGRATIAVRAGGSAELFTDGENALGIPPADSDALAHAMVKLAKDPEMRTRLGIAARQSVIHRFNPLSLPVQVSSVYQPLIEETKVIA